MMGARKACTSKTRYRCLITGLSKALHQTQRVDEEGANDRGIQALVIEHQHRLVQARPRVHDKAAGAGLVWALPLIRRNKTLAVHQGHVQVAEGGNRTSAAIGRQTGDRSPFEQEGQQLGLGEDARDQLAVLEVVAGQGRLVLGEHAVDFIHALVWRIDCLTLAKQGLGDVLQAERGEAPGRRAQRFDAVDDQAATGRSKKMRAATLFAPLHHLALTPEAQRHLQLLGVGLQHAQVELHQVPANNCIRVMH
ncbi:hypothetical protein D3C78_524660 [compost metagenome]